MSVFYQLIITYPLINLIPQGSELWSAPCHCGLHSPPWPSWSSSWRTWRRISQDWILSSRDKGHAQSQPSVSLMENIQINDKIPLQTLKPSAEMMSWSLEWHLMTHLLVSSTLQVDFVMCYTTCCHRFKSSFILETARSNTFCCSCPRFSHCDYNGESFCLIESQGVITTSHITNL